MPPIPMPPMPIMPDMSEAGFQLSVGSTRVMIRRPSSISPIVAGMVNCC